MFLSELQINLGRRTARDLLSSPQRIHAAVLGCFPPGMSESNGARTLWRIDHGDHAPRLLMSSPLQPDLTALAEQIGWNNGGARVAHYDRFLDGLAEGQQWRFRLRGNPTVAVKSAASPGGRGKRLAHVTATQQAMWLGARASRMGVDMGETGSPTFHVTHRSTRQFTKQGGKHRVTIATAQFDGILRVVDPDELRTALTCGVGGARAYGCGLMTLAPINAE